MTKRVFLLYAAEDEALRDELDKQLASLRRSGAAVIWHDRQVLAGEDATASIEQQIDAADVILLLVTPDFLASDELQDEQVTRALDQRRTSGARVVPVVVRPCLWEVGALAQLEPLPKSRLPVTSWPNRDEAWRDVVRGVLALLSKEVATPALPVIKNEGRTLEDQLQAARSRKDKLVRVGASTAAVGAVEAEILELRRKLRERGQLAVGDALSNDRYVLLELLGKGGFATVWRAHDEQTRTEVAIKVLHPHLVREELRRERFFRGARVMASLQHPSIVRVLEAEGHDRGFDYFVMELVRGRTLRDAILKGSLARAAILDVLLKMGDALDAAHGAGHVHRDVKPANILLDESGRPKLTDFDLVGGGQTTGGTRTGVLGTIVYAAPEAMVDAANADARADVYGLGMTGVFCYYGKELPPSVMRDAERVIRGLACPEEVRAALVRATQWEVEDRWADVRAFCGALRSRLPPPEPLTPSVRPSPSRLEVTPESPSHISTGRSTDEPPLWAVHYGEDKHGRYATFAAGPVLQRMRWIPPGTFLMGSPENEAGRHKEEGPQHEVKLSRGFWVTDTPCTQALWLAVMGTNPSRFRMLKRPVERVSWEDCQAFLEIMNARVPDLGVRLPTEAEWEYACRGGTTAATWAGDLHILGQNNAPILDEIAWYGGNSGVGFELRNAADSGDWPEKQHAHTHAGTRPVGNKQANPFGLHDMLGNVWEWCMDGLREYTSTRLTDPRGPGPGSPRVIRGGSWHSRARTIRAAYRDAYDPGKRDDDLGFRFVAGQLI